MAMTTMIEYISLVSTPKLRPMVATMISSAPRAFMPAPSDRASQWPRRLSRAPT